MADFVYNIALGRAVEFYNRVDQNDPTNSVLVIMAIDANAVSDATLKDTDSFSAILATAAAEVTNTGYSRITLSDTDLSAFAPDDANDRTDLDIADQVFSSISAGDAWEDIVIGYDSDSTGGTDANIVPISQHDFAVTPDGSDITVQIAAAGFFRAA